MLLFFLLALASAYTNRNLIFEQKSASNQYRATQAFSAAEAGVDWAIGMLNTGRIKSDCTAGTDSDIAFRDRYLGTFATDGTISAPNRTDDPTRPLLPACVFDGSAWQCNCPTQAPSLPNVSGADDMPAFRLQFSYWNWPRGVMTDIVPGVVQLTSTGFSRCAGQCLLDTPNAAGGEAMSVVIAMLALRNGAATPPGAPVTVQGSFSHTGTGTMSVVNSGQDGGSATVEPANGITIQAGGSIDTTKTSLQSLAGTPGDRSFVPSDSSFSAQGLSDAERMFTSVFGMTSNLYRRQPGVAIVDCSAGCSASTVQAAVTRNPGLAIWANGNVTLDGNIGSATSPVVLVATGNVRLASGVFCGLLYSRASPTWSIGSDPGDVGQIRGAIVAEGNMSGQGQQSIRYNADILKLLRTRTGSLILAPGGWKDFPW